MSGARSLADAADRAALDAIRVGADEGEILAAQHNAIFTGGGDYPANEFIIGSDRDALLCRYNPVGAGSMPPTRSPWNLPGWTGTTMSRRCAPSSSGSRAPSTAPITRGRTRRSARLRG